MRKITKILFLLILSLFIFSYAKTTNATDIEDILTKAWIEKYGDTQIAYPWIDISQFTYMNPDSNKFFGKQTLGKNILEWKTNNDPHFNIVSNGVNIQKLTDYYQINESINLDVLRKNAVNARKNVELKIHGLLLMEFDALKAIVKYSSPNDEMNKQLAASECNFNNIQSKIKGYLTDYPKNESGDVLVLNSNYNEFTCINILFRNILATGTQSTGVIFLAGMGTYSSKYINEYTAQQFKSHFTRPESKNDASYHFNKKDAQELTTNTIKKFASIACYEIKPKGTSNACINSISTKCKANNKNIFALYGITCEDLNTLFADEDSASKVLSGTSAAEKERIKVKFQVPFGDIKDGITLPEYINALYKYLLSFGLVLGGILLAIGGFQYIAGKPEEGKKMITNSITGIALLSSVYIILKTINPATLELPEIAINETARDTINQATMLNDTEIKVPHHWYALKNAEDPFSFKIAAPSTLTGLPKEKIWNTHYYTLFYTGSETKQGIYRYPIIGKSPFKTILWANTNAWCATSMEGSGIFVVGTKVMPIHTSSVYCTMANSKAGFKNSKDSTWNKTMDQTLTGNTCSATPPVKQIGGETPKCSWWYTHTNSLWQTFHKVSQKRIFGGAGSTGGTLIPLRSIAVVSSHKSVLNKFIADYGIPNKHHNLLVYIPDAKGKQLKAADGSMIVHDGYFWVSDYGGLTGNKTSYKIDTDGTTKTKVDVTRQIDMFTGTIKQHILDGNLHDVYIISCRTEPGKSICEKFYKQQMSGYPNIEKK